MKRALVLAAVILSGAAAAVAIGSTAEGGSQDVVDFGADRWDLANAKVVDFLGRKALMGTAFLKDVAFRDGIIEFDVAASTDRARSYPGVLFRVGPGQSWERVYIRPHRQLLYGDVIQYLASFNGVDSWQFYNGYGATASAAVPVKEWLPVKLEVAGEQARVFLGGSARPALVIPRLKHGRSEGTVGVMGPADGTAYFSNVRVRTDVVPAFDPIPQPDESPGALVDWQVSKPFPLAAVDLEKSPLEQGLGDPGWKPLRAEPGGLVDVSRLHPRSGQPDVAFARTVIRSAADEIRRFDIGYSDIVAVFLDGRPLFLGDSRYQYRDSSFLGIAGYFDSVFLPLRKGDNELLLAVGEVSGGWGFMVRDGRAVFSAPGVEEAWLTERTFRVPESAAFDPARDRLFVSNYDAYNPSRGEGRQFISKLTLDGRIESPDWVGGLSNPTGLCVVGDRLFAVERQSVAEIDILQAKVLAHHPIPGAMMPNDIAAAPDGALYITDSNRGAIFRLAEGRVEEWLRSPEIARPNGIAILGSKLYVGVNAEAKLKAVDLASKAVTTVAAFGPGIIDGLAAFSGPGGDVLLVSHNEGRLFRVSASGRVERILDTTVIGRPLADFAYLAGRAMIVVPTFTENRVAAYRLAR
jgi:hypothetical protein